MYTVHGYTMTIKGIYRQKVLRWNPYQLPPCLGMRKYIPPQCTMHVCLITAHDHEHNMVDDFMDLVLCIIADLRPVSNIMRHAKHWLNILSNHPDPMSPNPIWLR